MLFAPTVYEIMNKTLFKPFDISCDRYHKDSATSDYYSEL
ncbi:hypothetical protein SEEGA711_01644 [Salmonella enterica subsp. enterica serovar Gaminara str. ATCC BAA-711]|nr:hypothetical protein SEEGA711_01644 [Salmonella enterica subsp. enterica serovar Gaminara str. ATCC BAA-711]